MLTEPHSTAAFQLLRQTLPYVHAKARDVPSKLRFIMNLPVEQVPVLRKTFNNSKAQNIPSYLIQATGALLSQQAACERCQRQNGVYHGCVVSRDPLVNQVFRGACAGCWYGRMGSKCTLRYTSGMASNLLLPDVMCHLTNAFKCRKRTARRNLTLHI